MLDSRIYNLLGSKYHQSFITDTKGSSTLNFFVVLMCEEKTIINCSFLHFMHRVFGISAFLISLVNTFAVNPPKTALLRKVSCHNFGVVRSDHKCPLTTCSF